MRVAIIGAGWAGLAAAIELAAAGARPTVFEAARNVGGRARALHANGRVLDNGQHILIGAYAECLRLMRRVGVQPEAVFHREPLALTFADGTGLRLPDLAPPWDALAGIARARGWRWRDKAALLRTAAAWRLGGFRCAPQATVAQLCARLPRRLVDEFIDPLCVSALNTPAHQASGQVFLRVLQDSLFSGRGGSHLLLPRTDLGSVFAEPAARWLAEHGASVHTGRRVQQIAHQGGAWRVDGTPFDAVVLATPSTEAVRLLRALAQPALQPWLAQAEALRFIPITTVYAQVPGARGPLLAAPMLALRAQAGQPAQFVFDRGQLGGPAGLLAFVVSTSAGERAPLEAQVLAQARAALGLAALQPVQTVVEKRATFACTPALRRPQAALLPGLWATGDYIDGPYPATLEGAVRSGCAVARALLSPHGCHTRLPE
ncbi:MAG: desaturase [Burkholderiales bacterium 68-20]|nr:MAG: desaturase [Burkholderiales bacterium 68-20]